MRLQRRSDPLDLRGRRIFMTGGTGFVGRCLLDYFVEVVGLHGAAPQVTVLSRTPERFLKRFPSYDGLSWLRFVQGDLNQLPEPTPHLFTDVLHAAADTHAVEKPLVWLDQLVQGTRSVLDFALACDAGRFLLVSSGATYGPLPQGVDQFREDSSFAPSTMDVQSLYGQGKRLAEHLCAIYGQQYGLECVIARCFAMISKHMPLDGPYAVGNFLRDALSGRDIEIYGDGSNVRTYLDGRDAAHWLVSLLRQGKAGEIYNVGSDVPVSIFELAQVVAAHASQPPLSVRILNKAPPGTSTIYVPAIEKAGRLGLRIDTSLDQAVAETLCALGCTPPC